jgi:aspartyl protease family protein
VLTRFIVLAGAVAVSSVYFGSKASQFMEPQPLTAEPPATMRSVTPASVNLQASGTQGKVTIAADAGGQFASTFRLNGRTVSGMIDTGATYVAINETTARKVGISGSQLNYTYDVNTANGTIKAAHVMLDRVEIGSLRVQDVEAFVLKDKALNGTLIGMSFLKKLTSFSVKDGSLSLVN